MSEGRQPWSYTSSPDHQVAALSKTPVVSYPFGGSAQPESLSTDSVSVEDPRLMHGRVSASDSTTTAEEQRNEADAAAPSASFELSESGASPTPNDIERAVGPMPQAQALAQVRKHILGSDRTDNAPSGRLVAERFSVGWVVYAPAVGVQGTDPIYYVADDGELEETSSETDPALYLNGVRQRFWQRQALLG